MATRKSPKRVAAGKKAAATRKKNAGKTRTTRTTRTTTKKTFLSEVTSRSNMRAGGEMILQAAAGGAIANEVNKNLQNQSKMQRVGILVGLSYLAAVGAKMPNIGAGVAAVAAIEFMKPEPTMQENGSADYLEENELDQLPDVINMDENNPFAYMSEEENNQYAYMSESPYDLYNLYQ